MMYKYTLGFVIKGSKVLLINREKQPWKGCWNGLGGKIKTGETKEESILRELEEETGLVFTIDQIKFKGEVTWNLFDAMGHGLYLFIVYLPEDDHYLTPKSTDEGILDWKEIDWVCDFDNLGVAHNIPYFLKTIIEEDCNYRFNCVFEGNILLRVVKEDLI